MYLVKKAIAVIYWARRQNSNRYVVCTCQIGSTKVATAVMIVESGRGGGRQGRREGGREKDGQANTETDRYTD